MFKNYILFSQANILPESYLYVTKIWHDIFGLDNDRYSLYMNKDKNTSSLLMMTSADDSEGIFKEIDNNKMIMFENHIREFLSSDWRRQILKLEESVKSHTAVTKSAYLQLRHIEVPLRVYQDYLDWRRDTIFEHVMKQKEIEFFLSYHSVLSTEPGVMFLSGFSCKSSVYLDLFNNDKYREIVRQAGDKFISGGEKGLYTTIYERL